ncbi:sensor histidine kinase [Streptacidiphilus carbonis]|uniref:sensor histidine kinase n=1 Tax=Streptacidiphilus carbonis TaxID=105422 RepID=UPI0005A70184|nr:sensor histidine kinase [Streptacidiphilus carbonis]
MSSPRTGSRAYPREPRWSPLLTVGPYVVLAVLAVFRIVAARPPAGALRIDLALCGLAAAWILWMFTLHPQWTDRPRTMTVFFTGLVLVMGALVSRNASFGVFALIGYPYAFVLLPWPGRLVGVGAVAVLAGTAQAAGVPKGSALGVIAYLLIVAVNVLAMCGLAWSDQSSSEQSEQRRRALEELAAANRRLEATLADNEGLHAQLLARAREDGVRDERRRMAREIHDTLAQGLTGIITQLQAAEHAEAEGDLTARGRHLSAATGLARESLTEARRSVDALRPESLETARLSGALAEVAGHWSELNGVTAVVTTTGDPLTLTPEAELTLLRTAQEALANIAKHARASRVGVTLSYLGRQVALDVRDDGVGFDPAGLDLDPADTAQGGFGLVAMRQRIEALQGNLEIESEPGAGTGVSACVPVVPVEVRA